MTFTYTYRDTQGAVRTDVIAAASRQDVFANLKAKGITPLSVKAGGVLCAVGSSVPARRPAVLKAGVAGLVVMLGAAIAWFCLASSERADVAKPGQKEPVAASRQKKISVKGMADTARTNTIGAIVQAADQNVTSGAQTNAAALPDLPAVGTAAPPPPSLPPPVFDNASDQIIAMAVQDTTHGLAPIPMGTDAEKEFLESLKKEIVILDTDDEQTKSLKEAVKATREEIRKLIDAGKSFNEIMQEHQRLANENARIRNDATLELKKILESGDIEGAKNYKRKINIALGQMGISGLSVPVTEEERSERAAARRERMLERRARQAAQAEAAEALKAAQQGR